MLIISGPVHTTVNSMAYQELEQRLTEYGLQLNEIRTYITLAMRGPKKASDLAKACELSRMDTYRILKRLESKGLIETALQKPMRFAAVPPEKAFEILIGTAKEKISILEQERNRFLELWRSIPQEPLDSEGEKFRILWGRVDFFSTIKRMCSAAARRICILTTRNGLSRLYHSGLDDLIQDLKGVDVKILAEIDNANLEAAERFASIVAVRHVKPTSAQFVIIDESDIVVNMALDDSTNLSSENDTSLWTNSRGYTELMQRLFDKLWGESLDAKDAVRSVKSGVVVPETSAIYEREQIFKKELDL
ncbi:MAG: TrmB family transcriptional regulator, partial [Thaumarchaeota archaeon]|nr:TrmB family transcriptional regulator [Nitrososphaerota archaeon]